jgi:hypothetical protein
MGLLDNIRDFKGKHFGGSEPTTTQPRAVDIEQNQPVPTNIFGDRQYRVEPAKIEPYDNHSETQQQENSPSIKDLASQLSKMMGVGNNSDNNSEDESQQNSRGLFSEKYLRSVAELRLSQLKIKYNLKVSVLKMSFGKMLEVVGKNEQAKNVWNTEVTLGSMDEVIQEIIYLDLKHQNKMGTLKPLTPDEYFSGMFTTAIEKMGGDGFNNYLDLATGGFEKAKEFLKPKSQQQIQ